MASITDIIAQQVKAQAGGLNLPANLQQTVLNGLSESILGSLTQTATKAGGINLIKEILTGKANAAAASPVIELAGKIFNGNAKNMGLDSKLAGSVSAVIPAIMSKLSGILKDQDGDGDVDLNDVLITLQGGGQKKSGGLFGTVLKAVLK